MVTTLSTCKKFEDYFRNPDTRYFVETIQSTVTTAYAANVAMALMQGYSYSNVSFTRSNAGFPCTTTMIINMETDNSLFISPEKADMITIWGLWTDASTAILNLLFTNFHVASKTFDLVGLQTVPVIRDGNTIHVALATIDVSLNPDQEALASINLTTGEIESALLRLDNRPTDVYIAVSENAYIIDVSNSSTSADLSDDNYTLTGGGQMVEVTLNSQEIAQMGLINVVASSSCISNPLDGYAFLQITGVENKGFPELGTALLEFNGSCSGKASVLVATGIYVTSNGSDIPFNMVP